MRRANKAIIGERHPIPSVEELLHRLNGSIVFSKLNLNPLRDNVPHLLHDCKLLYHYELIFVFLKFIVILLCLILSLNHRHSLSDGFCVYSLMILMMCINQVAQILLMLYRD